MPCKNIEHLHLFSCSYLWLFLETCTSFQLLLLELFGENPDLTDLAGIVIDRGNIIVIIENKL